MKFAAPICVLASLSIFPAAVRAGSPSPMPAPTASPSPPVTSVAALSGTARILEPADAVAMGSGEVDAELGTLDGGPLTKALEQAAKQGRALRLLLDPYDQDSRLQSDLLGIAGPAVKIRWIADMSIRRRWMGVAGLGWLRWTEGRRPLLRPAPAADGFFEADWARGWRELPRVLRLRDQLDSLPDPRERSPHFQRRARGLP